MICQYLEDRYPEPPLYPRDVAERARARWLEEFADSRMGDVFIWRLFNQMAIRPRVWNEPTDQAVVRQALEVEIPAVLDYLESAAAAAGLPVRRARHRRHLARLLLPQRGLRALPGGRGALAADRGLRRAHARAADLPEARGDRGQMLRTPIPKQRDALREIGVALTRESLGTQTPRRGVMPI